MTETISCDALVVGGGIAGLWTSKVLSELGLQVVLAEQSSLLGTAASRNNEGWLHAGTYHATSIRDEATAIKTSRQCRFGHDAIRAYAPECIETYGQQATALVHEPALAELAEDRWTQIGVAFQRLPDSRARTLLEGVDLSLVSAVYNVDDLGVNNAILISRLARDAERAGSKILLSHRFRHHGGNYLLGPGAEKRVECQWVVLASGYGLPTLLKQFGSDINIRLWRSHMLYGPQILRSPAFFLDPGFATMMNHSPRVSVVGLNEDAYRIARVEDDLDPNRADLVARALRALVPSAVTGEFTPTSCIKVDIGDAGAPRGLHGTVARVSDRVVAISPGKMTQAPFIAGEVARTIVADMGLPNVPVPRWQSEWLADGS